MSVVSERINRMGGSANARHRYDTQDSVFDLAWSEAHENQVVVGSGDGSVKLFDTAVDEFPVQSWQEHNREVFSVHWNLVGKDTFASSSWDGTVKIVCLLSISCTYSLD
jgi:WD40 repeat protein